MTCMRYGVGKNRVIRICAVELSKIGWCKDCQKPTSLQKVDYVLDIVPNARQQVRMVKRILHAGL